jgi:hypothetical protein
VNTQAAGSHARVAPPLPPLLRSAPGERLQARLNSDKGGLSEGVTGLKNGPARTGVRELTYRLVFMANGTQACVGASLGSFFPATCPWQSVGLALVLSVSLAAWPGLVAATLAACCPPSCLPRASKGPCIAAPNRLSSPRPSFTCPSAAP